MRLDIPLYVNDPVLDYLGSKSGGPEVFRGTGVRAPEGFEHLRDEGDVVEATAELKRRRPEVRRVVTKLNQGFSGEGNAIFPCEDAPEDEDFEHWVRDELPRRIRFKVSGETWERSETGSVAALRGLCRRRARLCFVPRPRNFVLA